MRSLSLKSIKEENFTEPTSKKKMNKQQIFEKSYIELLEILDDKINLSNIVNVITRCVEIVDRYKQLTGVEKKMMVIKMITTLIDKHETDETIKKSLIDLLNSVGVSVIDTIIYAAKGKLAIDLKKWSKVLKMIKCCS